MTTDFDDLFAEPPAESSHEISRDSHEAPWKILIVDDDLDIHEVTKLALSDVTFYGRPLLFLSAFSGQETLDMLDEHSDCALVLLDVVMEEDDSGLTVVRQIREELKNKYVRIVLRTGNPGMAQERDIVLSYDINYYLTKSEITSQKLFTTVISSLRAYHNLAEVSREVSRVILNSAQVGIMVFDTISMVVVEVNPTAQDMLALPQEKIVGKPCYTFFGDDEGQGCLKDRRKSGALLNIEKMLLVHHGKPIPVLLSSVPVTISKIPYLVATFIDISERKQLEEQLRHLAYYDPLTELPNRVLFHERFRHQVRHARQHQHKVALLFIDLNDFKIVNDTHGHQVGDGLLQEVARRLQHAIRDSDCAARLSGDEFALILFDPASRQKVAEICQRIIVEISKPCLVDAVSCKVGASIGISLYPEDSQDREELLMQADMAMYQAKERKGMQGQGYQFFTEVKDR